jgi:plasmid stability protein
MHEIKIAGLDDGTIERLRRRAEAHGWSIQDEARHILTHALDAPEQAEKALNEIQSRTEEMGVKLNGVLEQANALRRKIIEDGVRDAESFKELDREFEDMLRLAKSAARSGTMK